MGYTTTITKPRIVNLDHASFGSFVDGHEVAIIYGHGIPDRSFSPKLAKYFTDELGRSVGCATLAWPPVLGAPWFARRLSDEVSQRAQLFGTLLDGYYLFRSGVGIAYAALAPLDDKLVRNGTLITLGLDLFFEKASPARAWRAIVSDTGIESTILHFDAALTQPADQARSGGDRRDGSRRRHGSGAHYQADNTSSASRDPYDTLGVSRTASDEEIRSRLRELQRTNHPDRVANMDPRIQEFANARLREILEAYEKIKRERRLD